MRIELTSKLRVALRVPRGLAVIAAHPIATHAAAFASGVVCLRLVQAWAQRRWQRVMVSRTRQLPPASPQGEERWGK